MAASLRPSRCPQLEGVQPLTTPDDNIECESIVRRDPRVQQLLLERYSVTNMELVICDSWTVHGTPPEHVGKRLMQVRAAAAQCSNL